MLKTIRLLAIVSRLEFLPAMASWFTIGVAWGINPLLSFIKLVVPATLAFAVTMISAVIGLQINTLSDFDLDSRDDRKKRLVDAMSCLGRRSLKSIIVIEFLFCFAFVFLLFLFQAKPALLLMWIAGIFLTYAYSAPPLRLKSRGWLSLVTLILIICILPLLFVFHTFTSELDIFFLLFLIGQALSVYSLILSTEIRDFFEDSAMGIQTMTVNIGLVKASFFSIVFLGVGCILTVLAFFLRLACGLPPLLNAFLLTIGVADIVVLRNLKTLYFLSKEYTLSKDQKFIAQNIRQLAAHSPQWIILASQAAVFMSILLIIGRFLP